MHASKTHTSQNESKTTKGDKKKINLKIVGWFDWPWCLLFWSSFFDLRVQLASVAWHTAHATENVRNAGTFNAIPFSDNTARDGSIHA